MVPFIQRSPHFLNTWLNSTCHKFSNAIETFTFFPENQCFKNKKIVFAHHCIEDMSTIIPRFFILLLILTLNIFCKDDIGQEIYRGKVVCYDWRWAGGGGLVENQLISRSTQFQYLKTTPNLISSKTS